MLRTFTVLTPLALSSTFAAGACGAPTSVTVEREADVYAVVIEALASDVLEERAPDEAEPDPVIYAGPLEDEHVIPLEVQVSVIDQLEDLATVRFVDTWTEALHTTDEGVIILEEGLLVLLGPVPSGSSVSVDAERLVEPDRATIFLVHAEEDGGEWTVTEVERRGTQGR